MSELKKKKIYWVRLLLCAVFVCVILAVLFYLHSGKVAEIISGFSEKDEPNLIWFFEHVSLGCPVFLLVGIITLLYMDEDRYVSVFTQLEKLIIFLVAAAFTYTFLLPYVFGYSIGESLISSMMSGEEVVESLWDKNYTWFFAQIIPFIIVISYHLIRICTERKEMAEARLSESVSETDGNADSDEELDEDEDDE